MEWRSGHRKKFYFLVTITSDSVDFSWHYEYCLTSL